MSDVFISYANQDRPVAERLAEALAACRWVVWWDSSIDLGVNFRATISRELNQAKCVIVIWSRHSVESSWVCEEAESAAKRCVLIPIRIDDAQLPLGFGQLQTGDFTGWKGGGADPRFKKLVQRVRVLAGGGTEEPPLEPTLPWYRRPAIVAGLLAGALAVAGTIWWYLAPPQIDSFTASPHDIAAGGNVRLEWRVRKARAVFLRPGPGEPLDLEGSHAVTPPIEAGDFEYRLFAEGRAGPGRRAEAHLAVRVLSESKRVAEAASFAAEWRRGWAALDESRIRAFTNEPFYCFGRWFATAGEILSSSGPAGPVWAATRPEPEDDAGGAAIWTPGRFRTEPSALIPSPGRAGQLLADLRAAPDDLVVVFRPAPGRPAGPPGPQVICALISKRSGRWMVMGVFDPSAGR